MKKENVITESERELLSLFVEANAADQDFIIKSLTLVTTRGKEFLDLLQEYIDRGDINGAREYVEGCTV